MCFGNFSSLTVTGSLGEFLSDSGFQGKDNIAIETKITKEYFVEMKSLMQCGLESCLVSIK